jgi:hypothetical protein
MPSTRKIVKICWDEEGVILVNTKQWVMTYILKRYEVWFISFVELAPQEKISTVFILLDIIRSHRSLRITWSITNIEWAVCGRIHPTVPTSPHQITTWLAIWEKPALTSFHQLWDGAERLAPVAVEEAEQLLLGGNTESCSKVEEECRQMWRLHCKITPTTMLFLKFCEIFTCRTWKYHEIKNKRHYFLACSCTFCP